MSVVSPPGYLQAGSYAAADDRRNIVSAMAARSIRDTFNTGARGGFIVGKLPSWTVSGWVATVSPCTGVVENTFASNAGEYVTLNTANQALTHTASSGTLNRIDIAGIVVDDAFYSGALNDAKMEIVQGTAVSGTPTAPTLPSTFLPIYQASIPAGSSTPTITTMVKATAAAGGIPVITTAQLADIGGYAGEQRAILTAGAPLPTVLYEYYGTDGLWHGTQSFTVDGTWQNGTSNITLPSSGAAVACFAISIPDPGYQYRYKINASLGCLPASTNLIYIDSREGSIGSTAQFGGAAYGSSGGADPAMSSKRSPVKTGALTIIIAGTSFTGVAATALFSQSSTFAAAEVFPA